MKPWHFAVVSLTLLASAGCRTDPAIPILERELRRKEDEIYRLRGKLEDIEDSSTVVERRPEASQKDSDARGTPDRRATGRGKTSASEPGNAAPPLIEMPGGAVNDMPDTLKGHIGPSNPAVPDVPAHLRGPAPGLMPNVDQGGRSERPGDGDGRALDSADPKGPVLGEPANPKGASRGMGGRLVSGAGAISAAGDSRKVAAIALNRDLTGGIHDGGRVGDQGLLVVVEPRDGDGRGIDAPADMIVSVLDPSKEGEAARVARWEFSPAQTAAMFRRTSTGPAIHVETAWPDGAPIHSNLHVFVRYTTADGRKLEADQPIEIAPVGGRSGRPAPQSELNARSDRPTGRDAQRSPALTAERPAWSPERR